jgi:hypothetical protein
LPLEGPRHAHAAKHRYAALRREPHGTDDPGAIDGDENTIQVLDISLVAFGTQEGDGLDTLLAGRFRDAMRQLAHESIPRSTASRSSTLPSRLCGELLGLLRTEHPDGEVGQLLSVDQQHPGRADAGDR